MKPGEWLITFLWLSSIMQLFVNNHYLERIQFLEKQVSELTFTVDDNCKELKCIRHQFMDDGG
jgi:hypothetical protein